MSDFRTCRIGDLANTYSGSTPSRGCPHFYGGNIPWVKSSEVNSASIRATDETLTEAGLRSSSVKWIEAGTPLVAMYGATAGKVGWLEINATTNQAVLAAIPNKSIVASSKWLYWSLLHSAQSLLCRLQGSGQPNLSKGLIDSHIVQLPPALEQPLIAQILDTLDTAIRETEALIDKLKAVKQGLLHDLLTRGIDSNGQLRPPQSEAPQLYKESPLGWIPREWGVVTLESVSSAVTSGSRDWARFYSDSGALFVRIGNLTREHINFRCNSVIRVQPPENGDGQRTKLEPGDILVSITADLGIIGVVPEGMGEAYINQHIALVRPSSSLVNSRFVGHYLAGPIMQAYISQLNDAGAKAGLNLPTIRNLPSPFPSRFEQDQIAARLDEIDNRIQNAMTEAKKLSELKSGLMDDLLTGRVRVTPLLEPEQQATAPMGA